MDSVEMIGRISIIMAGATVGIGAPITAIGEGWAVGNDSLGPAARRSPGHLADAVHRPGDDRIVGDLLLRRIDDPDLRQPVLESLRQPHRNEVDGS